MYTRMYLVHMVCQGAPGRPTGDVVHLVLPSTALRPGGLTLTTSTGRAKYHQVADDLRAKIAAGTYEVGGDLPSTSRIMDTYVVSSTVAKFAIRELKAEGLVVGQPGKGVYVLRKPDAPKPSPDYVELLDQIATLRDTFEATIRSIQDRLTSMEKDLARLQAD
jgi:DNA-binding GntR family transcriptional regulator